MPQIGCATQPTFFRQANIKCFELRILRQAQASQSMAHTCSTTKQRGGVFNKTELKIVVFQRHRKN